jgi:hypothetical protein
LFLKRWRKGQGKDRGRAKRRGKRRSQEECVRGTRRKTKEKMRVGMQGKERKGRRAILRRRWLVRGSVGGKRREWLAAAASEPEKSRSKATESVKEGVKGKREKKEIQAERRFSNWPRT